MARERALEAVRSTSGSCGQVNPGPKDWWPKGSFFQKVFGRWSKTSEFKETLQ